MSNTITLLEPNVDEVMVAYAGLQLERGQANTGPWTNLGRQAYITSQETYVFEDAGGTPSSWYRSARYTAADTLGPYSGAWPVSPPLVSGVTLAEIEQLVARKSGPYYQFTTDRGAPSSTTQVTVPALRSNVELDLVMNLWVLRRGIDYQGALVPVSVDDRQRTVSVYESQSGAVHVDRAWAVAPALGEVLEFHHLDPTQELRPSVLAGLRRCFIEHRETLPAGYYFEVDMTDHFPWLRQDQRAVERVEVGPFPTSGLGGGPWTIPFKTFGKSGHVWLRVGNANNVPYNGGLAITFRRAADTLVNGLPSTSGPTVDGDVLEVDRDYAAAAGHIEAWHNFPARLQAAAAGNLQMSQKDAAVEFTRQARKHFPRLPDLYQFDTAFPSSAGRTVVNA